MEVEITDGNADDLKEGQIIELKNFGENVDGAFQIVKLNGDTMSLEALEQL